MPFSYVLHEPITVLVADDDPTMREFASVYLSSPTAKVVTVSDGVAALEAMAQSRYDVLLLDLDMPEMNGFDVLELVRKESATAQLPVIVITGREDIASIDRAFTMGATSFAVKPVNWRVLAYQVKDACEQSKQRRPGEAPKNRRRRPVPPPVSILD